MNKKILLSLILCGALFAPSVQAINYDKAVALTEGADTFVRGLRISKMTSSKKPADITNMATANMVTSGLIIAAKLWFGGLINPTVIPNIFDLLRAKDIAANATRIAKNNASRSEWSRQKLSSNQKLLGMLMAEGGTSLASRFLKMSVDIEALRRYNEDVDEVKILQLNGQIPPDEAVQRQIDLLKRSFGNIAPALLSLPVQLVSFILWIIRYRMEGKLLKKLMKKPSGSSNGDVAVDDDDFEDDDDE